MGRKLRPDGDGSLYQMHVKDCPRPKTATGRSACKCRWKGAVVTGYRDGKAIRKTVTAKTQNAASVRLNELKARREATTLPTDKVPTVEQWLNYCHSRLLRSRRPSTLVTYRGVFDNYLIPLLGHIRLDRLTAEDIEDAWETLAEHGNPRLGKDARPLSPTTIHHAHTILSRCLRLAMQKKKLGANPAGPDSMDAPPPSTTEAEPLATEEWQAVLDAAPSVPNAARYTVALALGLRQGEAIGLRWSDVDLDAGTLRVRQILYRLPGKGLVFGEPKTERSKRTVTLPPELVPQLRKHRTDQAQARLRAGDQWHEHDLVFTLEDGRPLDPSVDRRRWKKLLALAGVRPIKLHAARHTAATVLLLEGVDQRVVMDIMGWSQIRTAANYQHAVKQAQRDAMSKVGAAMLAR